MILPAPHLRGHHPLLALKRCSPVGPSPLLHTGDGDDDGPLGPDEDGRVDDSVLLGPHQFLPVQDQHVSAGFVGNLQVGDASPLVNLGDLDGPVLQGLVQGQVVRRRGVFHDKWENGHVTVGLPSPEANPTCVVSQNLFHRYSSFSGIFPAFISPFYPVGVTDTVKIG